MVVKGKGGNFRENVVAAAKADGQTVEPVAEQQQLIDTTAPVPSVIGEKFLVRFVREGGFKKEENERTVGIDFSTALTAAHDDLLDPNVLSSVKFLRKNHAGGVSDIEIPAQTIEIFLAPEMPNILKLIGVEAVRVNVDYILEKGSGKETKALRLSWRTIAEATQEVVEFIRTHFDESLWMEMRPSQGVLKEQAA
jgi:hypothetical protein